MSVASKKYIARLSRLIVVLLVVVMALMLLQRVDGLGRTNNRPRPPSRTIGNGNGNGNNNNNNNSNNNSNRNDIDNHRGRVGSNNSNKRHTNTNINTNSSNGSSQQASMLARAFRILHDQGGTTAVLNGCRDTVLQYEATVLVKAALLAGNPVDGKKGFRSRGVSSGILNALLGCCCSSSSSSSDSSSRANMAIQLMRAYDSIEKTTQEQRTATFKPDLVALCLAHVATSGNYFTAVNGDDDKNDNTKNPIANEFLRRAEQFYYTHTTHSSSSVHDTEPDSDHNTAEFKSDRKPNPNQKPNWSKLEENYGIQVLKDAREFVVLSKPSGMVCYHGSGSGGGGNNSRKGAANNGKHKHKIKKRQKQQGANGNDESLEECLLAYGVPLSTLNQEGRGLVHRIDRGTSGCLVVAKTNRMHAFLLTRFFLKQSKKSYSALVCSCEEQLSNSNTGRGGGNNRNENRNRTIVSSPIDGRPATSNCVVEQSVGKHLTRITIETEQGRRHQVRIHCSEGLKAPILLDPLYGGQSILSTLLRKSPNDDDNDQSSFFLTKARENQQFCLHASTLKIDAVGIDVEAPLPEWWQQLEEALR